MVLSLANPSLFEVYGKVRFNSKAHSFYSSVLNLLIGSSFKSGSVLKRLELKEDSVRRPYFVVEEFKGKSRVINLKANIEIPTRQDQVGQ